MNERIQLLAKQAEKMTLGIPGALTPEQFREIEQEKFAELIINDCIDCVDGYTKPRTFDTHYDAVEQIKANFGIK